MGRRNPGMALRLSRTSAGVPQWQLARALGIAGSRLSRIESGQTRISPEAMALYHEVLERLTGAEKAESERLGDAKGGG